MNLRAIFPEEGDAESVAARLPLKELLGPTATRRSCCASGWPARTTTRTTPSGLSVK